MGTVDARVQVCENVKKALQSFGHPPPKKPRSQGGGQRRRVRPDPGEASGSAEATPGEATSHERLVEMHAQLLKRMMLPLTLRLALGCEKANPAQPLDVEGSCKATNSEMHMRALHTAGTGRTPADSASLGNADDNAVDSACAFVQAQKEETEDTGTRTYVERLRAGYWHIAPSIFHTLFSWLKRKRPLKVVLYTRDYLRGPHITRVIEEFNDLCEGKHPAFDGQNRTKQVFMDGRKKTKDMRISSSQVGSVTLFVQKPSVSPLLPTSTNEYSSFRARGEETSPSLCFSDNAEISYVPRRKSFGLRANTDDGSRSGGERDGCWQGPQECHQISSATQPSPPPDFAWEAEFPSGNRTYKDIHEVYTGLMYDILAEHNVVCLCFGSPALAPASAGPCLTEEAIASSRAECQRADPSALRLRVSETGTWPQAPATPANEQERGAPLHACSQPSQKVNSQTRQSRPPTAQKSDSSRSRPLSAAVNKGPPVVLPSVEKSCPLQEGGARGDIAQVLPRQLHSSSFASSSSSTGCLYPVSYSLDAPLVPLPVLIDPVDYSLYHVCVSAPALLSVQHGLSYLPSLKVVEVVGGSTIFGAVHPLLFSAGSAVNADASNLPSAAPVQNCNTPLRQLHSPAADVDPTPVTGEAAADYHHRGSKGKLLHSALVPTVDAPIPSVDPTFRGTYLVISAAYCVIITEPCSLLCNPEHLLGLTEQCIECRLRQLNEGKTEKDTFVLTVENAQQTPIPVGAAMTAYGGLQGTAQAIAGVKEARSVSPEEKTPVMPIECKPNPTLPQKSSLSEPATRRTTLKCLDCYAHLTAEEIKVLHPRDYLKATIVPVLLPALESILRDRPEDPLAWMAFYLLRHAEGYERTA